MTTEQSLTPQQIARDEYLAHIQTLAQKDWILATATKLFDLVATTPGMFHAFTLVSAELAAAHSLNPQDIDDLASQIVVPSKKIVLLP